MNKKLLAVAITGALGAASALPASADIKIIGKFYPAYQQSSGGEAKDAKVATSTINNSGDGVVDTTRIEAYNSYLRFSGEIDAGGGISGFFQCETALDFDDETGTWCGRNSAAGIKGGFGRVFLGKWDTPFKQLHFPTNMFGISSGSPLSNSNLLSRTPYSDGSSRASFHRRQDNSVQYWSPDIGGLTFKAMWGTEEADTENDFGPERTSFSLNYEMGPLEVGVAYELHKDFRGATAGLGGALDDGITSSEDDGIALVAVYKLGKSTEIGVEWETLTYENDTVAAGALTKYERDAYRIGVEHKVGNWILAFNYGIADEGDCTINGSTCSTSDLGATQTSIGAMYNFTKALGVFAWWTEIDNDNSASYSFLDDAPTGADPRAIAIGIHARF